MRASLLMIVLLMLGIVPAYAARVALRFRAPPIEVGAAPMLGDVAEIDAASPMAKAFEAIELGQAPMPGHRATITASELLEWIRSRRPDLAQNLVWGGPASVTVVRPGVEQQLSKFESDAERVLADWLHSRCTSYEIHPVGAASGSIRMSREAAVELAVPEESIAKRMAVWATVHEPGLPDRSVPLWFSVSAMAPAWVAAREISAGAAIDPAAVRLETIDISDTHDALPAGYDAFTTQQAVTPISEGRVLTRRMLVDRPMVAAGDRVRLRALEGTVAVESVGIAEQSGAQGQRVRVTNARSGDALSARVVAVGIVEAMP